MESAVKLMSSNIVQLDILLSAKQTFSSTILKIISLKYSKTIAFFNDVFTTWSSFLTKIFKNKQQINNNECKRIYWEKTIRSTFYLRQGFCSTRFNANPEMMQPISKLHELRIQLVRSHTFLNEFYQICTANAFSNFLFFSTKTNIKKLISLCYSHTFLTKIMLKITEHI